jgi:DNA-binding NtrC family response regulator
LKKALVVDDTKSSRVLLAKCLEHEGYAVTTAGNGKQALDLLQSEEFQIIFLDIKMPFMSGTEVYKWILKNDIHTPVVVTTAYATVKNAVECTRMGAVAYLQKPFTLNRFRELLAEIEPQIYDSGLLQENTGREKQGSLQIARQELKKGSPETALRHLKQTLLQDPANPEIYFLLSEAYALLGNAAYQEKFKKAYEALQETKGD